MKRYELPAITGGMVLGTEDEADLGLREEFARMRAEIERLRAALTEVRDATAVPLPDPIAHSWRAFYDAACTRLTRCANAARRALEQKADKEG